MDNMQKVEKLREKANVSYEEAKAVLEECDWDILDAIVKLEAQGKIKDKSTADYSTKGTAENDSPKNPQQVVESYQDYEQQKKENDKGVFHTIWNGIKYLFRKGCENKFVVKKDGEQIMEIPVVLMILLMLCLFWCLLILMVVSLFFGFSYGFTGPELGRDDVNNAMGKATKVAENIKAEAKNSADEDAAYAKSSNEKK